jgi:hypothetical protein
MRVLACVVGAACVARGEEKPGRDPLRLRCRAVEHAPVVDGSGADESWKDAPALDVTVARPLPPDAGASGSVTLRAVRTATHVYLLAEWADATQDDAAHKPWVWSADKGAYVEGPEREDMFSVAFEHTGRFVADMLSGQEGVWDVWQWKATRTNPQGYAMDRTHRYTREKPEGKAKEHKDHGGLPIWIARPEDAGETVEKKQAAPAFKGEERVPQYLAGSPTGSAADVKAKGAWKDGRWTLEFERRLDTGHADDRAFDGKRSCAMAVGTHDRTGEMDKASEAIELFFEEEEK